MGSVLFWGALAVLGQLAGEVEALARGAVAVGEEAPDRPVVLFRDTLGARIDDAVARMHEQDLAEHELARGADLEQAIEAALEARGGLCDPRMLYQGGGRLVQAHLLE